jgi:hypothetical protein
MLQFLRKEDEQVTVRLILWPVTVLVIATSGCEFLERSWNDLMGGMDSARIAEGDSLVNCAECSGGAPQQFEVTFTGVTNGTCNDCNNVNGDHVLDHMGGCNWKKDGIQVCSGSEELDLDIGGDPDEEEGRQWTVTLTTATGHVSYFLEEDWSKSCQEQKTLTLQTSPGACNWPDTITVKPKTN